MGQNTSIEWAHHTHNPWWGCVHVSPACDNCYAEDGAHHAIPPGWLIVGQDRGTPRRTKQADPDRPEIWGADAPRIFPPDDSPILTEPLRWNLVATSRGERHHVFVASMCDIFERHLLSEVNVMMDRRRGYLFRDVIPACPSLDFLLLTKRPHDIMRLVPSAWHADWPANVWAGCTVEDQQRATQRVPHLLQVPSPVRFISAEPLLGPLDLSSSLGELDWVIAGGESGPAARPALISWTRSLRDQVRGANTAFFFKQWGHWGQRDGQGNQLVLLRRKDSRFLDRHTWNEFPRPSLRTRKGI
jgi:protein gp37